MAKRTNKKATLIGFRETSAPTVGNLKLKQPPPTPKIHYARNQKRVVDTVTGLPKIKDVLTKTKGEYPLPVEQQDTLALILTKSGATKEFYVLTLKTFQKSTFIRSMVDRVEHAGYIFRGKIIVTASLLENIYAKHNPQKTSQGPVHQASYAQQNKFNSYFTEMVELALEKGASDIHIVPRFNPSISMDDDMESTGVVMYRIHGKLIVQEKQKAFFLKQLVATTYANTDITDEASRSEPGWLATINCNCIMRLQARSGTNIELRFQQIAVRDGFDAVLRILKSDLDEKRLSLPELGYSKSHVEDLELATRGATGAIILAGVTGSGKTTTLASLLEMNPEINKYLKTYTVEDPPEYKLRNTSQCSVQRSSKDDAKDDTNAFASAMKDLMRADPDRIMIGEVRDRTSGMLFQSMVESGHKVFGTTHSQSGYGIIQRFTSESIQLKRDVLTGIAFISALVYQRLLPTVCLSCRMPVIDILGTSYIEEITSLGIDVTSCFAKKPNGCDKCNGSGVVGRTVVAEVWIPDRQFLQLVRIGDDIGAEDYLREAREGRSITDPDMRGKTAHEHAFYKMSQGLIDPQDVDRMYPIKSYLRDESKRHNDQLKRSCVVSCVTEENSNTRNQIAFAPSKPAETSWIDHA